MTAGDAGTAHARTRVAVVLSHPVQYYSPWFRRLAERGVVDLQVFYLWDAGGGARMDRDFGVAFAWDVPLLDGYGWTDVPNVSADPGTHRPGGLDNPGLVDALLQWRPDVILLFGYAYRSHLRVLFSPRLRAVPKILRGDSHELAPRGGLRARVTRALRRAVFTRFDAALAVGRANHDYLTDSGFPADRIAMAPHCVDNARFRADPAGTRVAADALRAACGIAPGTRVLLFVGKFEDKKRPLDLLEAFAAARAQAAGDPLLLFVGSGMLEPALRARAQALGVADAVRFLGFQNQSAMPAVYAAGQVLVLPSHGAGETWGLCVNEAMNLGLPAVVSSHVGCGPDLVLEGRTGWRFPAGDVPALAATLARVLALPAAALDQVGHAARDHVQAWSLDAAAQGLEGLAGALHARRGGRR